MRLEICNAIFMDLSLFFCRRSIARFAAFAYSCGNLRAYTVVFRAGPAYCTVIFGERYRQFSHTDHAAYVYPCCGRTFEFLGEFFFYPLARDPDHIVQHDFGHCRMRPRNAIGA